MKQFSHSKLQTYERCPLQYKFQYLTNLKGEGADTIEAFMGSRVHDTLELLYRDLLKTKLNSLDDLIKFYDETWRVEWNDEMVISNESYNQKHYYDLGIKCVKNYYEKYQPFDQDQTLGIEKKINLKWDGVEITGYIDRLSREEKGTYAIHDYKTGSMMDQKYADSDRQLALYSLFVKQDFKEAKIVKLIWHYVAYGEDVISERSDKELKELKQDIIELITEINQAEKEDNFPAVESKCDWCGFWEHCPKKKHLFKVQALPKNEYKKESGVKLARQYIELCNKKSEINHQVNAEKSAIDMELVKIKEAIIDYAYKHKLEALDGGDSIITISSGRELIIPRKSIESESYHALEDLLRPLKIWPEVSSLDAHKLLELLEAGGLEKIMEKKIMEQVREEEYVKVGVKKKK